MRRPSPDEETALVAAIDAWGDGLAAKVLAPGTTCLVRERDEGLALYLVADEAVDELLRLPWPPRHAGLPLGRLVDGAWRPSLEAAQRVPRGATGRFVQLAEDLVGRFLYGRGIAADGVSRFGQAAAPGTTVFVYAPNGDALGIGRVVPDRADRRRLDPIIDLGWYLREGG